MKADGPCHDVAKSRLPLHVVGTAGHVDHGKSTLVRALTGIDPDRLAEEKARGMTIDLGFAWLTLPSGREISIIDVPGHERFIKNMLAGVGGIDLALVVIAADEGIMPQTREHLNILELLGVRRGMVVLTKRDAVQSDWLELVIEETTEELKRTVFGGIPVIPVSALTGEDLPVLLARLDDELRTVPEHTEVGAARLPVDRVFTLSGHGTVVTGTLIDGPLVTGQEVEIQPRGTLARVRTLQTHGQRVQIAQPGSRVAVNLAGLATTDVQRGHVLSVPGSLKPSHTLDVRLHVVRDAERTIDHNDDVILYTGAAEVPAHIRLLDARSLAPGETALAQLRLASAIAVRRHDRFILRRPSPSATIAGGEVLDPVAHHHRPFQEPVITTLQTIEKGTSREVVSEMLASRRLWELSALAERCQLPGELVTATVHELIGNAIAPGEEGGKMFGGWVSAAAGWQQIVQQVREELTTYHHDFPLRQGMPREELRNRINVPSRPWNDMIAALVHGGTATERGSLVARAGFTPTLTGLQQATADAIVAALEAQPFTPPALSELEGGASGELLAYLADSGRMIRVADNLAFSPDAYRRMRTRILELLQRDGTITVATVRDEFGASRRYALSFLEHLDGERVTRRVGDERVLGPRGSREGSG